jgi:uncharacterized protein (DUF1499 family)
VTSDKNVIIVSSPRFLIVNTLRTGEAQCDKGGDEMLNVKFMVFLLITTGALVGCAGSHLTVKDDKSLGLSQCMPLPNCVSSDSWMFYNSVDPFELAMPPDKAWDLVREVVSSIPRTEIVEERPGYIHAECRSLMFRFVDDLELLLDSDKGVISVRSSSAIGLFDLEVNYLRVENLRKILTEKGIIK